MNWKGIIKMGRDKIGFVQFLLLSVSYICMAGDGPDYIYPIQQMHHNTGSRTYSYTCADRKDKFISYIGESGHLMYGPYVRLPKGPKLVILQNIYCETNLGAMIDVLKWPDVVCQQKIIQGGQNIRLPLSYQVDNENDTWEFRLFTEGNGTVSIQDLADLTSYSPQTCIENFAVTVYEGNQIEITSNNELNNPQDAGVLYKYNSSQLHSNCGSIDTDGCRYASSSSHGSGHICFGPYVNNPYYGGEEYFVTFELTSAKNNSLPNDLVARIDITSNNGMTIIAARDLRRNDFCKNMKKEAFTLQIPSQAYENLEFRIYFYDSNQTYVKIHDVWMFSTGAVPVNVN